MIWRIHQPGRLGVFGRPLGAWRRATVVMGAGDPNASNNSVLSLLFWMVDLLARPRYDHLSVVGLAPTD